MSKPVALLAIQGLQSQVGGPFDMTLAAGECVSITGKSGSGKSVFLRLVADLDPGTGSVALSGRRREDFAAPVWRSRVVYQAAEPAWWAPTPVQHFPPSTAGRVAELMASLGLASELLHADMGRLSTGERQRLALIRSLMCGPAVLLLDEPAASLDLASTLAMEAVLLKQLASGLAIVMVTHSREQADRMGQRHYAMQAGRLHAL